MAGSSGNGEEDDTPPQSVDLGDTLPQQKAPVSQPLLPDAAEAYAPPRAPMKSSDHKTIENELVRISPDVDPQKAPTIRMRPERTLASVSSATAEPAVPRPRLPIVLWVAAAVMATAALLVWLARGEAPSSSSPSFASASPVPPQPSAHPSPLASFVAIRAPIAAVASQPPQASARPAERAGAPKGAPIIATSAKPGGEEPWVAVDHPAPAASARPTKKGRGEEPWVQIQ